VPEMVVTKVSTKVDQTALRSLQLALLSASMSAISLAGASEFLKA
jgi:hypothetical protein